MHFLVVDCETTGTDHAQDRVVEFAAVLTTTEKTIEGEASLVKPGIPIPPEASAVHHLVDADLADAPYPIEEVAPRLASIVTKEKIVDAYVAHNAPFDSGFLAPHLPPLPWLDTLRIARRYLPELPQHGNQYLRYALKLDPELEDEDNEWCAPHRALGDALVTAALLRYLLTGPAREDFERLGLEGFVSLIDSPMLIETVNFGKHKGKRWSEVPRDYLAWFSRNGEGGDPDVLFTVRHYLTR